VVALARDYVPELLDVSLPVPSDILTGIKLQEACDRLVLQDPRPLKMLPDAKTTQKICGGTKYIEQGCMPRMTLMQHRLSCVASGAVQPLGLQVARSLVACMYKHRNEGITFGGNLNLRKTIKGGMYAQLDLAEGAPSDIEVHGDATVDDRSVYAAAVTFNGGVVLHMVKKLSTVSVINDESSCENESIATSRCSQFAVYARAVATAFGMPPTAPTIIGTDNSANLTLSNGTATPGRAKHALRRWAAIRSRVASGVCRVVKVDTDSMPVDFMTKHKGRKMIDASVAYLTNSRNRVEGDTADVEVAGLEVSVIEFEHVTMALRFNRTKVARIARDRPPVRLPSTMEDTPPPPGLRRSASRTCSSNRLCPSTRLSPLPRRPIRPCTHTLRRKSNGRTRSLHRTKGTTLTTTPTTSAPTLIHSITRAAGSERTLTPRRTAWTLTGTRTSKVAPVDSFAPHQAQRERAQQTSLPAGASRHRGGASQAARSGTASVITHNADAIRRRIGGDA
jgi:hypothetical protein